jgi:hypothetical protein
MNPLLGFSTALTIVPMSVVKHHTSIVQLMVDMCCIAQPHDHLRPAIFASSSTYVFHFNISQMSNMEHQILTVDCAFEKIAL